MEADTSGQIVSIKHKRTETSRSAAIVLEMKSRF